jgi:hypothetical protein
MIGVCLVWLLGILSVGLICLWLLAFLYWAVGSRFEYQRISGARRYCFGGGGSSFYFVRFINYPNGRPAPANQNGIVSMGHELESKSFYIGEWLHYYRDAFYSPNPADTYDPDHPEKLAAFQRVIEHDQKMLILDFWPCLALVGFVPAVAVIRIAGRAYLRRRALRLTHCQRCGYDLRATPLRCPECGTDAIAPGAKE